MLVLAVRPISQNGGNIPSPITLPYQPRGTNPTGTIVSNVTAGNSNSGAVQNLNAHGGRYKCNMNVSSGSVSRTDNCTFDQI